MLAMRCLRHRSPFLLSWLLLVHLTFSVAVVSAQVAYYVSPDGNDGNPGSESKPFKTLEKARSVVRSTNGHMKSDIMLYLRGGRYQLCKTLVFDQDDSGTNGFSVIYGSFPGERAVISGGEIVAGWERLSKDIYKASVHPSTLRRRCGSTEASSSVPLSFRQVYVNGHRAIRARTPNRGEYYRLKSWDILNKLLEVNRTEINHWGRLNEVEMIILGKGVNQANLRISSFSTAGPSAFVVPREPERTRIFEQEYPPKESRPYYFENAFEFIDAPGEWYLDTTTQDLFYKPRPGEELASAVVVAPLVETLVKLQGTLAAPVHHIQFQGLTFEHTTWLLPNIEGFIGDQASIAFTQRLPADQITSYPGHRSPAAFHIESASNIRLERNTFRHLGGSAINLYLATEDNAIVGNLITDVSGSGISIDLNLEGNPTDGRKLAKRNLIKNNYIAQIGRDYYQSVGIMAGYTDTTVIEHNELTDMPYSGISVGWGWADVPSAARNNYVYYNKVSNVLNMMADGGAIYTLSRQAGTEIAQNFIHDVTRPATAGGFRNGGVFLDDGSNFITVQDNVFQNVEDMKIKLNNTGTSNIIRNNDVFSLQVVANAGLEPAYHDIRPREPDAASTVSQRNSSAMRGAALAASLTLTLLGLLAYAGYRVHSRRSSG